MMGALVFILLSISALSGQVRPADVHGWGKAIWGMPVPALKAAYGSALYETPPDQKQGAEQGVKSYTVNRLQVGEEALKALFLTYPNSNKIGAVLLTLPDGISVNHGEFERLREGLTRKYGKPTREDTDAQSHTKTQSATWIFRSTTIDLTLVSVPGISYDFLTLSYKSQPGKSLDTL